jgi:CRP-like cAMP-binding protein
MIISKARPIAFRKNLILAALPNKEYERLHPYLESVTLSKGKMLYAAGDTVRYAYFLTSGMVSLLSTTEDGKAIEVGMIGNEGVAGLSVILGFDEAPYQAVVQLPGTAMRIKSDKLKAEFKQGGQLHDLLLRYTHLLLTQLSQSASCNIFHTVKERLCRWLLISREFVHSDTLYLTQEFLSQMIGAPRTSVTTIAGNLQREGLIIYHRGKVQILDRSGLEAASCECYGIVRESIQHYIAA